MMVAIGVAAAGCGTATSEPIEAATDASQNSSSTIAVTSTTAAPTTSTTTPATTTTDPSAEYEACLERNHTGYLTSLADDPESLEIELTGLQFSEDVKGTKVVRIEWGQVGRVEPGDWMPYTTSADGQNRWLHTQFHANHRRSVAALHLFVGVPFEMPVTASTNGEDLIGNWDGLTLQLDGDSWELPAPGLMPAPSVPPASLDNSSRLAAWTALDVWVTDTIIPVAFGGVEALPALEDIQLEETRHLLCALLDTEWALASDQAEQIPAAQMPDHADIFYREVAVHDLLLLTEYVLAIQNFMDRPDVDWTRSAGYHTAIAQDGVTSDAEFLAFLQSGMTDAIWRYETLRDLAPVG